MSNPIVYTNDEEIIPDLIFIKHAIEYFKSKPLIGQLGKAYRDIVSYSKKGWSTYDFVEAAMRTLDENGFGRKKNT